MQKHYRNRIMCISKSMPSTLYNILCIIIYGEYKQNIYKKYKKANPRGSAAIFSIMFSFQFLS